MEGSPMAVGLMNEIKARARRGEDWERDFTLLEQRAEIEAFKQRIKGFLARLIGAVRPPDGQLRPVRA